MNPNVEALSSIKGPNLLIGSTCADKKRNFEECISRDWVLLTWTSKWLFGGI